MRSADFTPTAATLPPLYQADPVSYAQVDAYLGLADELARAQLERLEELTAVLGPDAELRWPVDLPLDAGRDALLAAQCATYDALAAWVAFTVPSSWGRDEDGVRARRHFLATAARRWRRRGTPRGFVEWFSTWFRLGTAPSGRPVLVEHYKVAGAGFDPGPYTGTLFVPLAGPFAEFSRRPEAVAFVHWYAPAHVALRICFVRPDRFDAFTPFTAPVTLPQDDTPAAVTAYQAQLVTQAALLRDLLCEVVSEISHADAIHLYGCPPDNPPVTERAIDHLGTGALPTEGI
jgi:hypothetical protein